jgi:hypothetical protein
VEKMNLNPLKKDDNTDALVKALEDANTTGPTTSQVNVQAGPSPQVSADPTSDSAAIAADPQINGQLSSPLDDQQVGSDSTETSTDMNNLTFDGNDLPAGMSSDANAHIEDETQSVGVDSPELDSVKKSALEQLRPLIEKLDLEPADKFDKYLMMLRASDDPALIKPAFDAAQGITGEKQKAQALLDIINEINYITANQTA